MKGERYHARSKALQILFQLSFNSKSNPNVAIEAYRKNFVEEPWNPFIEALVLGVAEKLTFLDEKIEKSSTNWRLDRLGHVDRNILRLGVYELFFCDDIPKEVTLNEMIELAKEFGSEQTSQFVNGILDTLAKTVEAPGKAK